MPDEHNFGIGAPPSYDHKKSDFTAFKERLLQYFVANSITDHAKKRAILIGTLNEETYILVRNCCFPDKPEDKSFESLLKTIQDHLSPVKSYFAERSKFFSARKSSEESISQWAARLKSLAAGCKFGAELDVVLRDIFVVGMNDNQIMDRLFEKDATQGDVTFAMMFKLALAKESALKEYQDRDCAITVKQEPTDRVYYHQQPRRKQGHRHQQSKGFSNSSSREEQKGEVTKSASMCKCSVCGRRNHKSSDCKYRNYSCHKCGAKGHLAPMCKQQHHHFFNENALTSEVQDTTDMEQFEEESIFSLMCNNKGGNVKPTYIKLIVEKVPIYFEADSGFAHSAISEKMYLQYFKNLTLYKNDLCLKDYIGVTFQPLGYLNLHVNYENKSHELKTYVIKNGGPPLLGRNGLKMLKLGIGKIQYISKVNPFFNSVETLCKRYPEIFENKLGTFNKTKIDLQLKEGVTPKFFKARPVPFALKPRIEAELDRLVANKILVPVEFADWGTPIVPVLKANGNVRICGDFKITLNPHLIETKYPLPRIEYLFSKLQGGKKFSKIDLSEAYQQVEVTERSRKLLTISTHKGLFSYTRLPYGITSAPAIFQNIMEKILIIPGVVCFLDDILVTGQNDQEHLMRLEEVFQRLKDCGLKVSRNKCSFFQNSVNYLGHTIDKDGLHTNRDRVESILKIPRPETVTQLKSFLGMVNFYCKFIPNASTVLKPLYSLLKKNSSWIWCSKCEEAFTNVKEILTSSSVLAHFDPDREIMLTVDASQVGLAAVISHTYDNNIERPIAFASRLLNSHELQYSQIEKEAAAIIFGVKKFFQYLYGKKFTLHSDHKPLLTIFGPKKGIPIFAANRLQRWAHILSAFNYEIKYISSKNNTADFLSRYPLTITKTNSDTAVDSLSYLHYIQEIVSLPVTYKQIKSETATDPVASKILFYVLHGWPRKIDDSRLTPFFMRRHELSVEEGCLMWGYRLIIPEKFRQTLLNELHETHIGMVKMKSLARSYMWWPSMDQNIEEIARNCETCGSLAPNPEKATLIPWPYPKEVWTRLHVDHFGPVKNKYFLLIEDATSKWIECLIVNNLSTSAVIKCFRAIFARFGLPRYIVSDNGTAFKSEECENYFQTHGIKHLTGAPFHPSTNGQAESGVKIMKNALLKALKDNENLDVDLVINRFLFQYRNTPHTTTGETPATLLIGRRLRSRFDLLLPSTGNVSVENQYKQINNFRGKRNITFKLNELVWVRDYRNNKTNWSSGKICKLLGNRTYFVLLDGGMKVKRHVDQIKPRRVSYTDSAQCRDAFTPRSILINNDNVINKNVTSASGVTLRPRDNLRPPDRLLYK